MSSFSYGHAISSEVLLAQFDMLKKQIPVLYSCLLVNMIAVSALFSGAAPVLLYAAVPALFTVLIGRRILHWRRQKPGSQVSATDIRRELDRTIALAWALSMALTVWVVALLQYAHGAEIILLAFFTWTTAVSTASNLAYLPNANKGIMLISAVPFTACIVAYGDVQFGVSLILFATFAFVTVRVLLVHFSEFTEGVSNRTELQEKQKQTEAAHQEVKRIALTDTLTSLPNRRAFYIELERLTQAAKATGKKWAAGVIDLNGFKPINDVFGHRSGDAVLVAVGQRLTETVGDGGMVTRLGGDEFGIIIWKFDDQAELLRLGNDLNQALSYPYEFEFSTAMLSGSCGLAIYPDGGKTPEMLLENADTALYQAKQSKSQSPVIYSPTHCDEVRELAAIEQALRRAVAAEAIELAYQPIIDLRSGQVVAFEALARWTDPQLGTVRPDRFIDIAEQTGLIVELTDQLLRKALATARTWPLEIKLSFNLSAILLVRAGYNLSIISALNTAGFSTRRLHLEITETALMSSFELARKNISELRAAGISIALDDFGTGYASFGYLDEITVDTLKIDRSFVPGPDMPVGKRQILKAIIGLSAGLGIPTILEGIEQHKQLEEAKEAGCDFAQGYLFARPMPAGNIAEYLATYDPDQCRTGKSAA